MTDPVIDMAAWHERLAELAAPDVTAAVVVQCDQVWLQPEFTAFRNEVEQALMTTQLRRGDRLSITRVILHNLPLTPDSGSRPPAVDRSFAEWHDRLSSTRVLLCPTGSSAAPRIHRLILRGDQSGADIPDMVELLKNGDWTDPHKAEQALRTVATAGATTPLTGYDMDFDGPFGDADPSIYM
ncbi:hypothetical protein [Streptomyces doebereineriae]|uniref:Uncharacterized protein n=1 Tax=Streptomyces doebereineriae TaxID=3075528 RepID=A0ABU2VHD3_9ACTN|nr:hypothetical protein [Streptomyces sp. DSM 41640]MDT0484799.1 hypothetical protein [Streptomyces sp. DSM 41640]